MSIDFQTMYGQPGSTDNPPWWDVVRFSLVADTTFENPFQIAGETDQHTQKPFSTLLVNVVERPCNIFVGSGKKYSLGRFYPGDKQLFTFTTEQDHITVTFQTDTQYTPDGVFTVDINHPILEVWVSNRQFNWHEFQNDGPPAVILQDDSILPRNSTDYRTADVPDMARPVIAYTMLGTDNISISTQFLDWAGSDYPAIRTQRLGAVVNHTIWEDTYTVAKRGSQRAFTSSFSTMFTRTLASGPYPIAAAVVAGTPKVVCSIWHPSSDSLFMRLRRWEFALLDSNAITDVTIWLCGLTTQPTGGSSMLNSPHRAGQSTTVQTRSAPSGGAADSGDRYGMAFYPMGVTAAAGTNNPPLSPIWQTLYDDTVIDGLEPLVIEGGTAFGFGLLIDVSNNATVHLLARAWFTEH